MTLLSTTLFGAVIFGLILLQALTFREVCNMTQHMTDLVTAFNAYKAAVDAKLAGVPAQVAAAVSAATADDQAAQVALTAQMQAATAALTTS